MGRSWTAVIMLAVVMFTASALTVAADQGVPLASPTAALGKTERQKSDDNTYHHVWPPLRFGWRIVLGSLIGFFGAAVGSVGGAGGGGVFVPMLSLIIGFDPKSAAAMSKCMIMAAAVSTVYCNLKLKHPILDMPLIDYNLALLIQPMLMLGVSIGVIFNVIFPDWLVTALLIILFLGTSIKAFVKGVETWKKETILKREDAERLEQIRQEREHGVTVPTGQGDARNLSDEPKSIIKNVYWKEFGLLAFVWMAFLALQIAKIHTDTCSALYWVWTSVQIPVSIGVSIYEAHGLMSGKRVLSSTGNEQSILKPGRLLMYCLFGIIAGLVAGLLGVGGGFILGPLFLELGIPPQVSSATATFAMMFSSSMSVVQYYLLHRFPMPYAAYVIAVAFIAAITAQNRVRKFIDWLGRASIIIFTLATMIFISAISLGGVGIANVVHRMERHQYMGFENLCKYGA